MEADETPGLMARIGQYYTQDLEPLTESKLPDKIWGVKMFLDSVTPEEKAQVDEDGYGLVEFTTSDLVDFLMERGYDITDEDTEDDIEEYLDDLEMSLEYVK